MGQNCIKAENDRTEQEIPDHAYVDFTNLTHLHHNPKPRQTPVPTAGPPPRPVIPPRAKKEVSNNADLVVAIDFGTTFTGYAFSFRHEYMSDPLKISTNMWYHSNGMSVKAPTAVLLHPDGTLLSFGYEACRQYAEITENGQALNYYFFHRFKMNLYSEQFLSVHTMLADVMGRQLPAILVFSRTIEFLKKHVMNALSVRDTSFKPEEANIQWILTVPAIWSDKSKQFMRLAAKEAGIPDDNLKLALEPEAAALHCKYVPVYNHGDQSDYANQQNRITTQFKHFSPGTKYMIVDLGGGTVDINLQEIQSNGALAELRQPSGGYWGGTKVDAEFHTLLSQVFGEEVMRKTQEQFPQELLDLLSDFEIKKRTFKPAQPHSVYIKIPACVLQVYQTTFSAPLEERLSMSDIHEKVWMKRDKLVISSSLFEALFADSVSCIIGHLTGIVEGFHPGLDTLLLVGGYSESDVIREKVKTVFPTMRVISPDDASSSILKGAVLFGHEPQAITARVLKHTYGIAMRQPFQEGLHPEGRKIHIGDHCFCDDVFDKHLKVGTTVKVGTKAAGKSYYVPAGQKFSILDVYASSEMDPKFVTDDSCIKLGDVVIELEQESRDEEEVTVTLYYNGTELGVEAREKKSNKLTKAHFNFLT